MHLIAGHDRTVIAWTMEKWGADIGRTPDVAFGILDGGGALRGALLLCRENDWTAELGVYSVGVITPGIAKAFFKFVFVEAGLHRLQMRTTRKNKAIKRAAPKMGWTFEGVARGFYGPGRDALCFFMTKDTCRWIKHHEISRPAASPSARHHGQAAAQSESKVRLAAGGVQQAEPDRSVRQYALLGADG